MSQNKNKAPTCSLPTKSSKISRVKEKPSRLHQVLSYLFSIDIRALGIFRVFISSIILIDLYNRAKDLKAHYTDFGVLPRVPFLENFANEFHFSFHFLSGHEYFQIALFIISAVFALMLLLGYKTKLATIMSWVLLLSLENRNPMVLNSGDVVFRMLLFWSMFLPLNATYSVDKALDPNQSKPPQKILSIATMGIILQILFVYFFSGLLKDHAIWNKDFTAVYYALQIDQFTTPLGEWLSGFPTLLKGLTIFVLYLELIGPFALFIPSPKNIFRTIFVFLFVILHVGFALNMHIGIFPFVLMTAWILVFPSQWWDWIISRLNPKGTLTVYYDGDCGFCQKMTHILVTLLGIKTSLVQAQTQTKVFSQMKEHNSWVIKASGKYSYRFEGFIALLFHSPIFRIVAPVLKIPPIKRIGNAIYKWVSNNRPWFSKKTQTLQPSSIQYELNGFVSVILIGFIGYTMLWNIRALDPDVYQSIFPQRFNTIGEILRFDQYWTMFAPLPLNEDGWYVMPGKLADGSKIDVFTNKPVTWQKPQNISAMYANQRWRKYLMNIWISKNAGHRLHYGRYVCRNWNQTHDNKLQDFEIYFMKEFTLADYQTKPAEKVKIWNHQCFE